MRICISEGEYHGPLGVRSTLSRCRGADLKYTFASSFGFNCVFQARIREMDHRQIIKKYFPTVPICFFTNYRNLTVRDHSHPRPIGLRPLGLTLLFPPRADALGRFAPTSPPSPTRHWWSRGPTCVAVATSLILNGARVPHM